jgi:hypothetical protein
MSIKFWGGVLQSWQPFWRSFKARGGFHKTTWEVSCASYFCKVRGVFPKLSWVWVSTRGPTIEISLRLWRNGGGVGGGKSPHDLGSLIEERNPTQQNRGPRKPKCVGTTWCGSHTSLSWIHVGPARGSHLLWVPLEQNICGPWMIRAVSVRSDDSPFPDDVAQRGDKNLPCFRSNKIIIN